MCVADDCLLTHKIDRKHSFVSFDEIQLRELISRKVKRKTIILPIQLFSLYFRSMSLPMTAAIHLQSPNRCTTNETPDLSTSPMTKIHCTY